MKEIDPLTRDSSNKDASGRENHIPGDLLVRAIDDELSGTEAVAVESHMARCEMCRQKHRDLRLASQRFEAMVDGFTPACSEGDRDELIERLQHGDGSRLTASRHHLVRRFGLGMAIAATLAIGVLFLPHRTPSLKNGGTNRVQPDTAFEVDGETFVALPYSNPELPFSASHIVQMQVPVASLTEAGIVFEPIANQTSRPDDSVVADVLLGIDGQPLGVHVVASQ